MVKKPKQKVSANLFLFAFLIVLIIGLIAFFGVLEYDRYKRNNLEDEFKLLNQQILLDDLYSSYLKTAATPIDACNVLEKQANAEFALNRELLDKLKVIEKDAVVKTDNYIKYMYVLTNIKLWINYTNLNIDCNYGKKIILYFYPEPPEATVEEIKSNQLTRLFENKLAEFSKRCPNTVVFALPYLTDIPILNQLIIENNVVTSPALVVDNNTIYDLRELDDVNCS